MDRFAKILKEIIEDVFVKVDKFYFPVDLVLDIEPVENPCSLTFIILGRPFLATTDALISCRNGVMKNSFRNMIMELNVFKK